MKFQAKTNNTTSDIALHTDSSTAIVNGEKIPYEFTPLTNGRYLLRIGKKIFAIDEVHFDKKKVFFLINGDWQQVTVLDEQDLLMEKMGFKTAEELSEGKLLAPMPGKILELMHKQGDHVELGEPVAILEAMKMENELKAPIAGIIVSVDVQVDQNVEKNEPILEIKASG